jgi:predicted ATP-dependent endonuclease of OLD family
MRNIDIIGIKNFRIFDDENGFIEEFAQINILTGANNSGKSSVLKFLQMLKDSIQGDKYPFDLDLTKQEHLLGDFDNVLFNKEKREIVICLPFPFLGIKSLFISLKFIVPSSKNAYQAKLREIEVIDKNDNNQILAFKYMEAIDLEKEVYKREFQNEQQAYEKSKNEKINEDTDIFLPHFYLFPPIENPLVGFIDWTINLVNLEKYLKDLLEFYKIYLKNKSSRKWLENADKKLQDSWLLPSELINSLKDEIDINTWDEFINNEINGKNSISGKEHIGERDFEAEDYFFPTPEIEDLLYDSALKILKQNLNWESSKSEENKFSVFSNCFRTSWNTLIQRINSINYLSTIKEENSRIYNATYNSPFIRMLIDFNLKEIKNSRFINKYIKAFEIGKIISVTHIHKYQQIEVSVTTLDNTNRDLVDFGYGIKHLILILIQISVLAEKNKQTFEDFDEDGEYRYDFYNPSMLLVEEPETNLHPKWQSLLAEMFVEANKEFNIQFVIETHSEYLIRKFQTLVADKKINGEEIKLFYLRHPQDVNQDKKQVSCMHIQQDGSINYQIFDGGFFDENDKLELSLLNIQRNRFLLDFDELKRNKEENENKIFDLEQKIDNYTNKLDISVYVNIISHRFDISKLSPVSVNYLTSGQFLLYNIDVSSDFSPVIIQYGRSVEYELKEIFLNIDNSKKWMFGTMQGPLETFKNGSTHMSMSLCNTRNYAQLQIELTNRFNSPAELKIDLINDIRLIRNSAGHSGQTKNKLDALDYISKVNEFFEKWIMEKK